MGVLGDFRSLLPKHQTTQAKTLEWLALAHTRAEAALAAEQGRSFDEGAFLETMQRRLRRFGCGEDKIATRGHETDDCAHVRWGDMQVYRLSETAGGAGMRARTQEFGRIAGAELSRLFAEVDSPPRQLIHVTCTGYESPSAAQLLVARKGWGARTRVTHAYHMGCYAALPAVHIAESFNALEERRHSSSAQGAEARVDIVHTELCSLHLQPLRHEAEQLVIQSLFADGCIAYSVFPDGCPHGREPGLAVLAQDEWVLPDSAESMAWFCSDFGMEMVLARDVPEKITRSLAPFVAGLLRRAGEPSSATETAVFAIHPGGPKIVEQVAATMKLEDDQIALSRGVLRQRGNMSSATLPHIWQAVTRSASVKPGQLVISLAFGPGLTLAGAVLQKVAAG
jgi:predicted naringenin-chalcone synthase